MPHSVHRSPNSCRSQVIIAFQPSYIKSEVQTVFVWRDAAKSS
jgi:hypothetical protein